MSIERITLTDNGEEAATEQDTANVLNNFFFNAITNLKITVYADCDQLQTTEVILFCKIYESA